MARGDEGKVLETLEEISVYNRSVQRGSGPAQAVPSLRGLSGVRTPVLATGPMKPAGKAAICFRGFSPRWLALLPITVPNCTSIVHTIALAFKSPFVHPNHRFLFLFPA